MTNKNRKLKYSLTLSSLFLCGNFLYGTMYIENMAKGAIDLQNFEVLCRNGSGWKGTLKANTYLTKECAQSCNEGACTSEAAFTWNGQNIGPNVGWPFDDHGNAHYCLYMENGHLKVFITEDEHLCPTANVEQNAANFRQWHYCKSCDLSHTYLGGGDYSGGVNLVNANLTGTDISHSDLRGAVLEGATLTGGTNISNSALMNANLKNVSAVGANLSYTDFDKADLTGADLTNANLTGAKNFNTANVTGTKLGGATMPDGTKHP